MSVYIVDDDIFYSSIMERHLENFKLQGIEKFYNIDDAINGMEKSLPCMVFMDIFLEKTNSLDHLKDLKERFPQVYFVLMTASMNEELKNQCYQLGAFYFLEKNKHLEKSLKKLLNDIYQYNEHFQ